MTADDALRDAVLVAALPHVAFDGWTRRALEAGAADAGLPAGSARRAFPDGAVEAIAQLSRWADRQMAARLAEEGDAFTALKVREKIARAVLTRLEVLAPHRDAVRRGLARLALSRPGGLAARLLYETVDAMWRAAGDTATDFNFYSKRALLAGVQASTLLVWLNDTSDDLADTTAFLDRRIAGVLALGRRLSGLERLGPAAEAPFRLAARLRRRRAASA